MTSSQKILDNLKYELATIEKTNDIYRKQINDQDTEERILLTSIRYL